MRRLISEMCGLGGVVPLTGKMSDWNGQVSFEAANSIAEICYQSTQHSGPLRIAEILRRVQNAIDALSAVCGWLQEQDLCCNSFTALVQTQANDIVETVSVPMTNRQISNRVTCSPGQNSDRRTHYAYRRYSTQDTQALLSRQAPGNYRHRPH